MPYAEKTRVAVDQTRLDIEKVLRRYGASKFAFMTEATHAIIIFEAAERRIRFDLPLPEGESEREKRVARQKWRALLLCIKAKLEAVASNIETFEEAFLAHVVVADGATVYEHVRTNLALTYKEGHVKPLLPAPGKKP